MSEWKDITLGEIARFLSRRRFTLMIGKDGRGALITDSALWTDKADNILRKLGEYIEAEKRQQRRRQEKAGMS